MAYIDDYLKSLQELGGMVSAAAGLAGASYEGPPPFKKKKKKEIEETLKELQKK